MGLPWLAWRAGYALRRRVGALERAMPAAAGYPPPARTPAGGWSGLAGGGVFSAPPRARLAACVGGSEGELLAEAGALRGGDFRVFGSRSRRLGWPVRWLASPAGDAAFEGDRHWSRIPTFDPRVGDIKEAWEPSRFRAAYVLGRAFALTGDDGHAETFWRLFEGWCLANPPNRGVNWKCGQEAALRSLAWVFALDTLGAAPSTRPARVGALVTALQQHAERILANIDFAVSQHNNHALSEAVGLLTLGLCLPELPGAARWEARGRAILEAELRSQFDVGGSYIQHSLTYHRMALDLGVWAVRVARRHGRPLTEGVVARLQRALELLVGLMDDGGDAPNYGPNDGTLPIVLSVTDPRDFRASTQAASVALRGERLWPPGPWDESALWCLDGVALESLPTRPPRRSSVHVSDGGFATVRQAGEWAMVRCHQYRHRPGHLDMLHVDLWWRGFNVLADSGSYRYFAPGEEELAAYFSSVAAHNTLQLDDQEPAEAVTRFLRLPLPRAAAISHGADHFVGESLAWQRAPWWVTHRREVRWVGPGRWRIVDDLLGAGTRRACLRWHVGVGATAVPSGEGSVALGLPGGSGTLRVIAPEGCATSVRAGVAEPGRVQGWASRTYGERVPRPTVEVGGTLRLPARVVTELDLVGGTGRAGSTPGGGGDA